MPSALRELRRVKQSNQKVAAKSRKVSRAVERPRETVAEETVGKALRNLDRSIPLPTSEIKREPTTGSGASIEDQKNATEYGPKTQLETIQDQRHFMQRSFTNWIRDLKRHNESYNKDVDLQLPEDELWLIFARLQEAMMRDANVRDKKTKEGTDGNTYFDYKSARYVDEVQEVLYNALSGLDKMTRFLTKQRDKVVNADPAKGVAFWSGEGAKEMAMRNGHVTLEGSMGAIFNADKYYKGIFNRTLKSEELHWSFELPLWAALSKHYAEAVSAYAGGGEQGDERPIYGYIGKNWLPIEIESIFEGVEGLELTPEQRDRIQWRAVRDGEVSNMGPGDEGRKRAVNWLRNGMVEL